MYACGEIPDEPGPVGIPEGVAPSDAAAAGVEDQVEGRGSCKIEVAADGNLVVVGACRRLAVGNQFPVDAGFDELARPAAAANTASSPATAADDQIFGNETEREGEVAIGRIGRAVGVAAGGAVDHRRPRCRRKEHGYEGHDSDRGCSADPTSPAGWPRRRPDDEREERKRRMLLCVAIADGNRWHDRGSPEVQTDRQPAAPSARRTGAADDQPIRERRAESRPYVSASRVPNHRTKTVRRQNPAETPQKPSFFGLQPASRSTASEETAN